MELNTEFDEWTKKWVDPILAYIDMNQAFISYRKRRKHKAWKDGMKQFVKDNKKVLKNIDKE